MSPSEERVARAEAMLREQGKRITPQRRLLLRIIEESHEHLNAEQIYLRAKREDPRLSLSTVYRTLAVLKEAGLVEQRYFARDHQREYFESPRTPEHYHFTCIGCGRVIEFETPRMQQLKLELQENQAVQVTHACVCLEGYCADCLAQGRDGQRIRLTQQYKIQQKEEIA